MLGWILNLGFAAGPVEEGEIVLPNEAQREPVFGGSGGTWAGRKTYRDKRRQDILDDDEDLLRLIEAAMPEIMKHLN